MTSQSRRGGMPLMGRCAIQLHVLLALGAAMMGCGNTTSDGSTPLAVGGNGAGSAPANSTVGGAGTSLVGGSGPSNTSTNSSAGGERANNNSSMGGAGQTSNATTAGGSTGNASSTIVGGSSNSTQVGGTGNSTKTSSSGSTVGGSNVGGTNAGGATARGGSSAGGSSAGGSSNAGGASSTSTTKVSWINANGVVSTNDNAFGIQGNWYAFSDGTTSTQTGNPYRDGKYCIKGTAPGDGDNSAHWGAGLGLDLNYMDGKKQPYQYEGKITGFKMKLTGTVPTAPRVQFVSNLDAGVSPFILGTLDQSIVYPIADAKVPLDWSVDNAGKGVEGGVLYSLQVLVDGAKTAGAIDLCISEFEPIYEPSGTTNPNQDPYVNKDGFIRTENNSFGIQGPVYAISDGNSSTQSGNPYSNGKYCIAGKFSGADSDWGAGIAFDLNKAPGGGTRTSYAYKDKVAGFRIGLSGTTPGRARIQFVINEPQEGTQPFLGALINTKTVYRIAWAQVPKSWDVSNAGQEVGSSLYTVQLYLEGDRPGNFNVCIDEFVPLTASELSVNAQSAASGFTGARTVSENMLQQEYDYWKANRLKDCGDGSACVPRDEGDCISEGIGYGMLISVGYSDQSTFDKVWAYFKKHKNSNGLMTWQTNACGSDKASGAATDGDLDVAMALLQAGCKWGGTYKADAVALINAIRKSAVTTCNGQLVLKPGDTFGGCSETNPSYIAPGYYKAFATASSDSSWNTMANDGYTLLSNLQGKMNGLVPNWTDSSATIPSGDRGSYGPDAPRTPWRVATDYVWNGETKAVTFLDKVATYVDGNGGVARLFNPNTTYRGGLALSGLQKTSAKAQEYTDAWLTTSIDDETYFPGTLRPIYLLLASQKFAKACN